jgi:uncharacterized protein
MYHSGEVQVQTLAGAEDTASKISRIIRSDMPPVAEEYLALQSLVVVGTEDANGMMWASAYAGEPGFAYAADSETVQVNAQPPAFDPIYKNLETSGPVGLIATDFVSHRRMRVNGTGHLTSNGLTIHAKEVYSNCGRYIQTRRPSYVYKENPIFAKQDGEVRRTVRDSLTSSQQAWIRAADTFFIATSHPGMGADASHKGGSPGFVQVLNNQQIRFLDYPGNSMFNTLGNILINPHVGLLFFEFAHGHTLQLTGKARVLFGAEKIEREALVTIEKVIEVQNAIPLSFEFVAYARTNPKL